MRRGRLGTGPDAVAAGAVRHRPGDRRGGRKDLPQSPSAGSGPDVAGAGHVAVTTAQATFPPQPSATYAPQSALSASTSKSPRPPSASGATS